MEVEVDLELEMVWLSFVSWLARKEEKKGTYYDEHPQAYLVVYVAYHPSPLHRHIPQLHLLRKPEGK
jgi:hypothetical protein